VDGHRGNICPSQHALVSLLCSTGYGVFIAAADPSSLVRIRTRTILLRYLLHPRPFLLIRPIFCSFFFFRPQVYDVRTMRSLPPFSFPLGPFLLRFHPKFSSTVAVMSRKQLLVASCSKSHTGNGQFQLCDAGSAANSDVTIYQVCSSCLSAVLPVVPEDMFALLL
jgi:hypothetical protein